jgi:alkyldihydroxyacetonephosphate synthase
MSVRVDRVSLLADVTADETLASLEAALARDGLTLGLDGVAGEGRPRFSTDDTLGEWLARGAPHARDRWRDPADHLLAGLEAELPDGRTLVVRPAPRRATGPDLVGLVVGAEGRCMTLRRAWVRVHSLTARVPETAPFRPAQPSELNEGEQRLMSAIERELRRE